MVLAVITLLHVLVFVYWLGGDLGAFYASTILTDKKQPVPVRATAAKVLENIDMSPRTALILTLPTGLTLARAKGWIVAPGAHAALAAVWIIALAWLAIAWKIHLSHPPAGSPVRRIDLAIRAILILALIGAAVIGGVGSIEFPLFIRLKFAVLATAIAAGLMIRRVLAPFGPAFVQMVTTGATPETDAAISLALAKGRPVVLGLWALLLIAALLGLATPL